MFLLNPGPFWTDVADYSLAAAEDLGVELDVYFRHDTFEEYAELIESLCKKGIDGVIYTYQDDPDEIIHSTLERYGVPYFIINSADQPGGFLPRTKYKYWIGEMKPDDRNVGAMLIQQLLNEAAENGVNDLHILGIEGGGGGEVTRKRTEGLESFVSQNPDVKSFVKASASWNRETAGEIFKTEYGRNPEINVVWCASDRMAAGVRDAIEELGIEQRIFLGGVNWSDEALSAIFEGTQHCSVGGHFMMGAWSVLMMYDYLKGFDFASEGLSFITPMYAVNKSNLSSFRVLMSRSPEQIDFIPYSKNHNDSLIRSFMDLDELTRTIDAGKARKIILTPEEEQFLRDIGTIRIHNEMDWPPFNFNKSDKAMGFSIDYMDLLAEKAGLDITYISGPSWNEFLAMIRSKDLDVMLNIVRTEDREGYLLYTDAYSQNPNAIVSRDRYPYSAISELAGKTIAIPEGFFYQEILERDFPQIKLLLKEDMLGALKAVIFGEADASLGEQAVIRYLIDENSLRGISMTGEADLGDEEISKLNIAVRDDWPQLRNILQKSMSQVTVEEMNLLNERWFGGAYDSDLLPGGEPSLSLFALFIRILLIMAGFLIVLVVFQILVKRKNRKGFNIRRIRLFSYVSLGISISFIILISYIGLSKFRKDVVASVRENMNVTLKTTSEALDYRIREMFKQVEQVGLNPQVSLLVGDLLAVEPRKDALLASSEMDSIRNYFDKYLPYSFNDAYFVVSPEGINLASSFVNSIGSEHVVFEKEPSLWEQVLRGSPVFIPPGLSSPVGDERPDRAVMYYAVPVYDNSGDVIAVLIQSEDPVPMFTTLCQIGRFGSTGETYAFDRTGLLLSQSRFDLALQNIGLLEAGQSSALNLYIKDPGGNLEEGFPPVAVQEDRPFTLMASEALAGRSGFNFRGYRDYRGVEVYGIWLWNSHLKYGLTIEVDTIDALESYRQILTLVVMLLVIIILVASGVTIFSISIGERANSSLARANDELEGRVAARTREVSESKRNLENTIEALTHPFYVIDVKTHEIVLANSAAKKASKGQEISTCYRLTHRRDTPCDSKEHPCPLVEVMKTKDQVEVEHIHFDENDNPRFVEVHGYPIFDDIGDVVQMIEYSLDITERKNASRELMEMYQSLNFASEMARMGYWKLDLVSGVLTFSDSVYRLLETTVGEEGGYIMDTETYLERYVHPEDRLIVRDRIAHAAAGTGEHNGQFEYRVITKSGAVQHALVKYYVSLNGQGRASVMTGIHQDLTERLEGEREIRKSRERFEILFDKAADAYLILSNGIFTDCNRTAVEMLGYDRKSDIIGHPPGFLSPEYQPNGSRSDEEAAAKIALSLKENGLRFDWTHQKKDGSLLPVEITLTPLELDGDTVLLVSFHDLSERLEQQKEIEQINFRSDVALELTNSGYWHVDYSDPDYYIQSERAAEILGDPPKADGRYHLQDEWFCNLEAANKETAALAAERYKGTIDGKYESYDAEYAYKSPVNGRIVWVHAAGKVVRNRDGEILYMYGAYQDITDQKRNEEALKVSQEQLAYAFEATGEGIWDWDVSTGMVSHNNTWLDMMGFDPSFLRHDMEFFGSLLYPEDADMVMKGINNTLEDDSPYFSEHRLLKNDGSVIWVEDRGKVVQRGPGGEPLRMVGSILDITERKRIEDEIKRSEERFKIATESAGLATWEWYTAEDRTIGSPMYETVFGFDPSQQKVSEVWRERLHPDDRDSTFQDLTDHLEGRTDMYYSEFRYRHPSNEEYVWLSGAGKIVERNSDGSPRILMGINQDITERKNAEQNLADAKDLAEEGRRELEEKHAQLQTLIEEMPIAAAHFSPTGEVIHMNRACTNLMGYTVEDIPTVEAHWDLFYPDPAYRDKVREEWTGLIAKSAETGEPMEPMFLDIRAKSGKILKLISNTIQFGELAITMWIDLTERVEFEDELKEAKELAEEATRAKSNFLANMSHEIRTPMNAIIGLSHLIQKTDLTKKQEDYIQKIHGSAHNLLGIINDILDFSKIEAGKLDIEEISFDLHDVFDNLGSMISEKARDKNLELVFHIGTGVPTQLMGDPLRLGQVLLNLANNAIKFTEVGEIAVSVELQGMKDSEADLKFSVRDTGIGLTGEQQGTLFQAFSQADTSTTRKYGGTGLGLSISKRLAEMMGGRIGVSSVYGEGSTFYFNSLFQVREEIVREIIPPNLKGMDVLIVDDNSTSQEVLTEYLKDFSLNPMAVDNGSEAIQLIRQRREQGKKGFELVLMDYSMPGLNGFQTSDKINELLDGEEVPKYILVTGYGRDEVLGGVEQHGYEGFVLKPVNQSLLFNTIIQSFGHERKDVKRSVRDKYPQGFDRIRGARILLAEDNEINQQVAREILEAEGFVVEIADNGRLAVEMAGNNSYELILMDLQMPVMGGYDATVNIRAKKIQEGIPIIAMTADAMAGVRETVLEAGMNDYITKPIDTSELWRTLMKWIGPGERVLPEGFAKQGRPGYVDEQEIPDISGIDKEDGVKRVGGNTRLYINLLKQFVEDFGGFNALFHEVMDGEGLEDAVRLAHSLKGVAANLGAEELRSHAEELERVLKEGGAWDAALKACADMADDIASAVERAFPAEMDDDGAGAKPVIPDRELKDKLLAAAAHLEGRKPKPAGEILDELAAYALENDIKAALEQALRDLGKYRMKQAGAVLRETAEFLDRA